MSVNLNQLFPKPVPITLGGREFLVSELNLDDLAELQAWIKTVVPHPLDALKGHLDGLPESAQKMLLTEAYREAKTYPPKVGSPEGDVHFQTPEGMTYFVYTALKKHNNVSLDEVKAILPRITPAEADKFMREVKSTTAEEEVLAEIDKRRAKGGPKAPAARRTGASS